MKFFKKYQFSTAFEIGNTLFSVHRVEGIKCGTRSCGIRTRSRARAPEPIVSHQGCLRSAFRGAVWLYVYGLYIYTRTHIRVGINTRVNVKVCPVVWAFVRRKRKEMNRKKATTSSQKKGSTDDRQKYFMVSLLAPRSAPRLSILICHF